MNWLGIALQHWRLRFGGFWRHNEGQDMIEYALLAGFIAVIIGAMIPAQIVPSLNCIYSKLNNVMGLYGAT